MIIFLLLLQILTVLKEVRYEFDFVLLHPDCRFLPKVDDVSKKICRNLIDAGNTDF